MTQKVLVVLLSVLIALAWSARNPVWADGPYRGKVIDAETKEPIEGAVVVAVWEKRVFRPVESKTVFEEAKEAMTDKDGEFMIPGYTIGKVGGLFGTQEPDFYIFKPGYGSYPLTHTSPPKENFDTHFRPYTLVELPKVYTEKDRIKVLRGAVLLGSIPNKKVPNWIRLINIERVSLGFQPTDLDVEGFQ